MQALKEALRKRRMAKLEQMEQDKPAYEDMAPSPKKPMMKGNMEHELGAERDMMGEGQKDDMEVMDHQEGVGSGPDKDDEAMEAELLKILSEHEQSEASGSKPKTLGERVRMAALMKHKK